MKTAVFDADGTLIDSMGIWYSLGELYLKKKGYEPKEGLWDEIKTMSLSQSGAYFKKEYHMPESKEQIMDEIMEVIRDFYYYQVQEKQGALTYIKDLVSKGAVIYVATASERNQIEMALKRLGILPYIKEIFTCTEVGISKNTAEFWYNIADRIGTGTNQMNVYEDAYHAVRTAKEAGCHVTVVYDLYAKEDEAQLRALADDYFEQYPKRGRLYE